jgi:Rps23 Pro-64 3,4-dihydroxylase Tpa1-like proline 4-hydroxylase
MTGIELNEKLALFYAEYKTTDHLLCHDDELEGRRIAFILYLSPQWSEEDGGTLDLFAVGDQVERKNIFNFGPTLLLNFENFHEKFVRYKLNFVNENI